MTAERSRWARRRDEIRGGPPGTGVELEPCGTYAAARRHERHGEELDPACLEARREYLRDANARARQRRRNADVGE